MNLKKETAVFDPSRTHPLRRVLGLPLLVGYGLGVIIGAGIYVLVGTVIAAAGPFAPLSFLLAGALAGLIAACYGELAARIPEAAGAAAYVKEAFGSDLLSRAVGLAVGAVVLVSTAALARGSAGYARLFVDLPAPAIAAALSIAATSAACIGVRQSVAIAGLMSLVEIGGLSLIVAAGWSDLPSPSAAWSAAPALFNSFDPAGVLAGAFIAFFAYIGFENMANMTEETHDFERTMPRAMLISLALSTVLYLLVVVVAVNAQPIEGQHTPLLAIGAKASWYSPSLFAAIALIAVSNGVLIEILMLSRLLYGMARRGWLPTWLIAVNARTATPVTATLAAGAGVLALAVGLDVEFLASAASAITLLIFATVAAALWRLQRLQPRRAGFRAPLLVPPLAAVLCLCLVLAQFFVR